MVEQLTGGRLTNNAFCHLDPDLDRDSISRRPGWRGAFGQVGMSQGHLANQQVSVGDLFLFWGLFCPARLDGTWNFCGQREHRIFGWMQIDEVVHIGADPKPILQRFPWLEGHPHLVDGWSASNTVYIAREQLELPGRTLTQPGWGLFKRGWRLTNDLSGLVSSWRVPDWLNPTRGGCGMTYHPLPRWSNDGILRTAARGQEFVANVSSDASAIQWIADLFKEQS